MIRRRGVWDVTLGIILALLGGQAFAQHAEIPSRGGGVSTASAIGSALYCEDAGGDDTYVCTLAPAITTLDKLTFTMRVTTGNTGAATVNVNGLGAKSIKKAQGGVTTDPADNDIRADAVLVLSYDGTNFQLQSTLGNAGAGTGDALVADPLSQFAATTSAQFAGVISDETGTGAVVLADSPTLVTPALGTPSAATLTNATGLPIATGVSGLGANVATALATPSSANVAAMITDETGTGAAVFANTPTLVTPVLGAATGTSIDLTGAATIEGGVNACTDSVGTDSYACSISPAITAYSTNTVYTFKAGASNTGAATLNLNAIGAQSIVKTAGGVTTVLADNDIRSGSVVQVAWDGTNFQLVSPVANATSSTITSGSTVTSGCVAGGVLRSISNMVECGAGITWSGGTLTLNNGASAVSPLVVQDNGVTFFELKDGAAVQPQFSWTGVGLAFNSSSGTLSLMTGGTAGILVNPSGGTLYLTDGDGHNRFTMPYTASSSTINNNFRLEGHKHANTSTGYGTGLLFQGRSTTTADNDMIRLAGVWTDATHASRSAAVVFEAVNGAAALAEVGRFNAVGGLKIATGTKPTCDATYRGTLYYVAGGAGVADTYEACVKDAGDSYAWTAIF